MVIKLQNYLSITIIFFKNVLFNILNIVLLKKVKKEKKISFRL